MRVILLITLSVLFAQHCSCFRWTQTRRYLVASAKEKDLTPVYVYKSVESLGLSLCDYITEFARSEISKKGKFHLAVPGGSVLKLLGGLKDAKYNDIDWSKVFLFYVNHKCLPNEDSSSTHVKAKTLFLNNRNLNVFPLSQDEEKVGSKEVLLYDEKLREIIPQAANLPVFDLVLLGVGKDGHIGSLYPGRPTDIAEQEKWVLCVDKKSPSSITLSLPVMNNAKEVRIVLTGADKAEAAVTGVLKEKAAIDFPVCGISNDRSAWMIDEACSSLLSSKYPCTIVV